MNALNDVLLYIYRNYPNPLSLGITRVIKLLFLADWKSCLEQQSQITKVKWQNTDRGPFSQTIVDAILDNKMNFGTEPENLDAERINALDFIVVLKEGNTFTGEIAEWSKNVLQRVVDETAPMNWRELNEYVRAAFPLLASEKYQNLDLVNLAERYHWVTKKPERLTTFIHTGAIYKEEIVADSVESAAHYAEAKSNAKAIGGKRHIFASRR